MTEKITVFGKEIRKGHCSCLPARIVVKRFDHYIMCDISSFFSTEMKPSYDGQGKTKDMGTHLTEDEIIKFLEESTSFETSETDHEKLLIINTPEFKIVVIVEERK
ncbi:MAG: hypothetical protein WC444_06630 [Candidatus Paceibacterota bacterium]